MDNVERIYGEIYDVLKESDSKEEFLDSVDDLLEELFELKAYRQQTLNDMSDDDWWTSNMS